jgi:Fe-S cluster biogenesis protein NfuA
VTPNRAAVEAAIDDLRRSLQADGGDLLFQSIDNGVVRCRLILSPNACLECILPKDVLEQVITYSVQERDPSVVGAQLEHPRIDATDQFSRGTRAAKKHS